MAEEPNSLSAYQLATPRPPFEVMVLDGIAVEGLPDPKRIPIILSSNGIEADAANLIHDYNIDITKKEEVNVVDNAGSIYPPSSAQRLCGRNVWRNFVLLSIK